MMIYTSTQIIKSARRDAMIPDTASLGTQDSDVLEHAYEQMISRVVPEVIKIKEEYYVRAFRTAIASGTSRYRMPARALLNKLRMLWWVDSNGRRRKLSKIEPQDLHTIVSTDGDPRRYYLEENDVVLAPTPTNSGGSLEFSVFVRPSTVVLESGVRQITAVDASLKKITSATAWPTAWTVGTLLDLHSKKSGAELKVFDYAILTITTIAPFEITFSGAIDGSVFSTRAVEVGDYACLAEEAAVPALPYELHPIMVEAAVVKLALSVGDTEMAQLHSQLFEQKIAGMKTVMESRVEGDPPRFRGRRGILRAGRW